MFICCLIRLHDTKSDIGSPVDLVDAIILWHVMARTAKKKKNLSRSRVVFSGLCSCRPRAVWLFF